jgi:hypothetical protein
MGRLEGQRAAACASLLACATSGNAASFEKLLLQARQVLGCANCLQALGDCRQAHACVSGWSVRCVLWLAASLLWQSVRWGLAWRPQGS